MTRLARAAIAVAALLVGAAAVWTAPTSGEITRPIEHRGAVGESVTTRVNAIRVTGIRAAHELTAVDGTPISTPGVWIVVRMRITPRLSFQGTGLATLRAGGVEYGAWQDPRSADFSSFTGDPGIPARGTLAFEVPADVLGQRDAELVFDRGETNPDDAAVIAFHPDRIPRVQDARVERATEIDLEDGP